MASYLRASGGATASTCQAILEPERIDVTTMGDSTRQYIPAHDFPTGATLGFVDLFDFGTVINVKDVGWHCAYCGNWNDSKLHECRGCRAPQGVGV